MTLGGTSEPALADVPLSVSAFPTPTASADPDGIVQGPDGAMWFTEAGANKIGRITSSGAVTEYTIPTAATEPEAITVGPDGALWFVQPGTNDVDSITTGDTVGAEVSIATGTCSAGKGSDPVGIASGSNGDLWVTEARNDPGEISEVVPSTRTVVTQNCLDVAAVNAIAPGSDGALWFTVGKTEVGRINTAGDSEYVVLPTASTVLMPIVAGPDGNLWVGVSGSPAMLDRITPDEVVTPFDLPNGSPASVARIGVGPDGQIWMAGSGDLVSMSTSGVVNTFTGIYPSGDAIDGIAAGPGDTLWLTDATTSTIYRVTLGTQPTPTPGSPTISSALAPVSNVGASTAIVAGTLSLSSGSQPQGVTYDFDYGPTAAYGSATAPVSTTVASSGTAVSANLTGLAPDTTYHYRLVASGCAPSSCAATSGDQSFTTGVSVTPVLNASVGVTAISGKVFVRLLGKRRFVRLRSGELIPVGSTINARHGHVLIESALAGVSQQVTSGIFYGGVFVVTQPDGATTTVLQLHSSFAACRIAQRHRHSRATIAQAKPAKRSKKVVNEVFGTAHGQYTTRGHYAAAADEGTSWETADRCDGTYIAVSVGQVDVTDLVRNRTFVLTTGQHYLAKPR